MTFSAVERAVFDDSSVLPSFTPLVIWGVPWIYIAFSFRKFKCPKCEERAFEHIMFFMKDAKCVNCGYSYEEYLKP